MTVQETILREFDGRCLLAFGERSEVQKTAMSNPELIGFLSKAEADVQVYVGLRNLDWQAGAKLEKMGLVSIEVKTPSVRRSLPSGANEKELLKLVADGESIASACRQTGISSYMGYKLVNAAGVSNRFSKQGVSQKCPKDTNPHKYPNGRGLSWKTSEDALLKKLVAEGKKMPEIAKIVGRSLAACYSRKYVLKA